MLYYRLAKPGIIYGNLLTAIGGFLLASAGDVEIAKLLAMSLGIGLVMASGCIINNLIDIDIDRLMSRTKNRALVSGEVTKTQALVYGSVLGIIGFWTLNTYTNSQTAIIGLYGWVMYVVVYGYFKRRSVHGTVVGSISGAIPPVVGYVAVTNFIDSGAIILFLVLVSWQMPHFYSIALFRLKDYKSAKIPVLPLVSGVKITKIFITAYILAFMALTVQLTLYGHTGLVFVVVMTALSLRWLQLVVMRSDKNVDAWARKMFGFSLKVLLVFSLLISIDFLLP